MKEFDKIILLFSNRDVMLIALCVLLLILLVLVFYLVKVQLSQKEGAIEHSFEEEPLITHEEVKTLTYDNVIEEYETNEEESAIISAEELEQKLKSLKEENSSYDPDTMIQEYEQEQEEKAIISYEELLNRASMSTLNYEETDIEGIKVNKIDVTTPYDKPKSKNTIEEEEAFLRALKEFRALL